MRDEFQGTSARAIIESPALESSGLRRGTEDGRGFHLSRVVCELAVAAVLEAVRLGFSPHDWDAGWAVRIQDCFGPGAGLAWQKQ